MPQRVYIDRIEGDRCVLLLGPEGKETITLPKRLLPDGVKEGAALDLTLTSAPDDTTRAEVQGLMDDLFGNS
jgi:hypothetical protein